MRDLHYRLAHVRKEHLGQLFQKLIEERVHFHAESTILRYRMTIEHGEAENVLKKATTERESNQFASDCSDQRVDWNGRSGEPSIMLLESERQGERKLRGFSIRTSTKSTFSRGLTVKSLRIWSEEMA